RLDFQIFVSQRVVVNRRAERSRHVLPAFEAVPRTVRLQADAENSRIQFLQATRRSDKRAAGSKTGDEMCNPAARLLPDFVCSASIMCLPVGGIAVLIRIEIFLDRKSTRLNSSH